MKQNVAYILVVCGGEADRNALFDRVAKLVHLGSSEGIAWVQAELTPEVRENDATLGQLFPVHLKHRDLAPRRGGLQLGPGAARQQDVLEIYLLHCERQAGWLCLARAIPICEHTPV